MSNLRTCAGLNAAYYIRSIIFSILKTFGLALLPQIKILIISTLVQMSPQISSLSSSLINTLTCLPNLSHDELRTGTGLNTEDHIRRNFPTSNYRKCIDESTGPQLIMCTCLGLVLDLPIIDSCEATKPEEADRSKQGNLSFSQIIDCLPTNSAMAVL